MKLVNRVILFILAHYVTVSNSFIHRHGWIRGFNCQNKPINFGVLRARTANMDKAVPTAPRIERRIQPSERIPLSSLVVGQKLSGQVISITK